MEKNKAAAPAENLNPTKKAAGGAKAAYPSPCVYCGPSVPGAAKQYAVYTSGIPAELETFIKEHPAARGLLVSVNLFPQARKRLETPGTSEYILYQKVRSEL